MMERTKTVLVLSGGAIPPQWEAAACTHLMDALQDYERRTGAVGCVYVTDEFTPLQGFPDLRRISMCGPLHSQAAPERISNLGQEALLFHVPGEGEDACAFLENLRQSCDRAGKPVEVFTYSFA